MSPINRIDVKEDKAVEDEEHYPFTYSESEMLKLSSFITKLVKARIAIVFIIALLTITLINFNEFSVSKIFYGILFPLPTIQTEC